MSRPPRPTHLPTRDGISPSCVALPAGPWATVLDFVSERLPAVSRADWAARLQAGDVVDERGAPVAADLPYPQAFRQVRRLFYWRSLPHEHPVPFEETIVFHDEHIVVADKPHFLPVTPKGRHLQETLLVRLKRRLGIDTLVPMHRLDLETAGLVAFIVQPRTRDAYQRLFRDRQVDKVYEAVAPLDSSRTWPVVRRSRLAESPHFMAMHEVPGEPNAETTIELIGPAAGGPRLGHYRLRPLTGQRHQLRVHMHALGLPLVNDRIYPTLLPETPAGQAPDFSHPLQLLARSLAFDDPVTGERRRFESRRELALTQATAQPDGRGPISPGRP